MNKKYQHRTVFFALMTVVGLVLTACQSTPITTSPTPTPTTQQPSFAITGKIGVTTMTADGKQGGSAFYAWGQKNGRFSIDLTGALGLGATSIRYDGQVATMTSEKTGTIHADSPEELLIKATGWHAPISQLPYWIVGQVAPNDNKAQTNDNHQLIQSEHGDWQATFDYNDSQSQMPNRLRISHQDGHQIVMTISHQPMPK